MLAFKYFKTYFISTLRNPPALFFTLIFPPLMLLITSHQWGIEHANRLESLMVFCNYSVQTVAFMLLGMGVSLEKNGPFAQYLRTMPVGLSPMLLGRFLHTLGLAAINLVVVGCVGAFALGIPVTLVQYGYLSAVALLGAIPMAMMGMSIGYIASPESSRSIFTLLNLLMLFGAFSLPGTGILSIVREGVPTYQWLRLSQKIIDPQVSILAPLVCLGIYTLVFGGLFAKKAS